MKLRELAETVFKINKLNKSLGVTVDYALRLEPEVYSTELNVPIKSTSQLNKLLSQCTYYKLDECEVELLEECYDIADVEYMGVFKGITPTGYEVSEQMVVRVIKVVE